MPGTSASLASVTFIDRLLVEKNPFRCAIQIVVLPIAKGPQEGPEAGQPHAKCKEDQPPHGIHQILLRVLGFI